MKPQSQAQSLIESLLNIGSGFFISLGVWSWAIVPLFELPTTRGENLKITLIFTAVSVARSYCWRRVFNRIHGRKN